MTNLVVVSSIEEGIVGGGSWSKQAKKLITEFHSPKAKNTLFFFSYSSQYVEQKNMKLKKKHCWSSCVEFPFHKVSLITLFVIYIVGYYWSKVWFLSVIVLLCTVIWRRKKQVLSIKHIICIAPVVTCLALIRLKHDS